MTVTQHIVISKGEENNLVYGWWYPGADFSFVVATFEPGVRVADIAKHIKEEWPDVTIHRRLNVELETLPDIPDDEDLDNEPDPDRKALRTMMRGLVKLHRESGGE